jgi:hypothetical protein
MEESAHQNLDSGGPNGSPQWSAIEPEKKFARQTVDLARIPSHVLHKWSGPVLNEGFVPFPKRLLRCLSRIFDGPDATKELAVVLAVVDFNRERLIRLPSLAFLSFLAGLPEDEVRSILERLKQKSFIQVSGNSEQLNIHLGGLLARIEKETSQ